MPKIPAWTTKFLRLLRGGPQEHPEAVPSAQQALREFIFAAHVGEPLLPALEEEGQLLVVHAQQFEDGGVEIVNVDPIFDRAETKFVGGADDFAAPNAASGQPGGEAVGIVVAPGGLVRITAVGDRCPAKFAAPNDE